MNKCSQCFYCRRGSIVTYSPTFTCLHPHVIAQEPFGHLAETCPDMRKKDALCGPEGALFRPATADGPEPLHKFKQ